MLCTVSTSQRGETSDKEPLDPIVSSNSTSSLTVNIDDGQNRPSVSVSSNFQGASVSPKAMVAIFKEMITDLFINSYDGEVSREVEQGTSIIIEDDASDIRLEVQMLSFGSQANPLEWQDVVNGLLLMLAKSAGANRWETMMSEFSRE